MATLRLRTEHQEQFNNLQKSQRPRLVKGRKNLGLAIAVLNEFIVAGKTETTSRDVADAIMELGLDTYWDRNPNAKDNTGLVKSIGDCLGNHRDALRLERVQVDKLPGVRLPSKLIDDQWLRDKGIDPDTCRHEAVVGSEPDPATEPTGTESDLEPESEPDLDPTLDALMSQLDDPELDAQYYRD